MNILVTGGAGYIGSHTVRQLAERGHTPIIYDNFITGCRDFLQGYEIVEGDIGDEALVERTLKKYDIHCVMNFASFISVGESVSEPLKYYKNNVAQTLSLLEGMNRAEVKKIVFSSSAAVYGYPKTIPITEDSPLGAVNPYGRTKQMMEDILHDAERAYNIKSIMLRYFNAAGAHPQGDIGENHQPETHLIPLVMRSILDDDFTLTVFGTDYDTRDGTCIRDYIHVTDLADAHVNGMEYLQNEMKSGVFNLGNGQGFTVYELIESVERVTGIKPQFITGSRREGDPAALVASSQRASDILFWKPRFHNLDDIVKTAWMWEKSGRRRGW